MLRSIVTVVLVVLLIVGCVMIYKRVNGDDVMRSGDVYQRNSGEKDQMETGTTYIGDKPLAEAHPTPSRSDEPGTINTVPENDYSNGSTGSTSPQQPYTPYPPQNQAYRPQPQPYNQQPYNQQQPYTPTRLPASDTFSPTPPNGYAYAGTGAYEVYRQGDLTFRLDTKSGASCVLYATMEEWSKPIVYSHGCGSRWWRRQYER